ncbi:hypothetical protein P9139_16365 [Curtobacterium flaccumfaciens]|nr:hypothetical protein P9139_16365 [Curtobacterium flaccumfaciens]
MHETAVDETPGFLLGDGVPRFSVRSASATAVSVVVDGLGTFPMTQDGDVWAVDVPGVRPGHTYHLLADGPAGPRDEFDPTRPLLDPYARGIVRGSAARWTSVVVDDAFDWAVWSSRRRRSTAPSCTRRTSGR